MSGLTLKQKRVWMSIAKQTESAGSRQYEEEYACFERYQKEAYHSYTATGGITDASIFSFHSMLSFFAYSAVADEYSDLRPGFVSSLAPEGIGLYTSPSLKNTEPLCRIGPGVSMYLKELLDTDWASVRFMTGTSLMDVYVRTGSLVMNDYGLGPDAVRLVSDDLNTPIPFYQEPSEKSKVHGQYYTGTLFSLYGDQKDGFARVALGEKTGYISAEYLFPYDSCATSALPVVGIYHPSDEGVSLSDVGFAQLSSALLPITPYPDGARAVVLGVTPENWLHVMIDGRTGYIHHSKLQPLISYKQ